MALNINMDYSRFFKGIETLKSYGTGAGKKDTLVRYEFSTTDENGNKVMDKMTREETLQAMKDISAQYGDNVIVQFSGDGMAALVESRRAADSDGGKLGLTASPEQEAEREAMDIAFAQEIVPIDRSIGLEEDFENRGHGLGSGDNWVYTTDVEDLMKTMDGAAYEEYLRIGRESSGEGWPIAKMRYLLDWYTSSVQKNPHMVDNYEEKRKLREAHSSMQVNYGFRLSHYANKLNAASRAQQAQNGQGSYLPWHTKAENYLQAYARLYEEIVRGYEEGTRRVSVADEESESGYRVLTMKEELDRLDETFDKAMESFGALAEQWEHARPIIEEHLEKIAGLKGARMPELAGEYLEQNKNGGRVEAVPGQLTEKMTELRDRWKDMYALSGGDAAWQGVVDALNRMFDFGGK